MGIPILAVVSFCMSIPSMSFLASGFLAGALDGAAFTVFLTRAIPQIGHLPGFSILICACIGQVQITFVWALAKKYALTNSTMSNIFFIFLLLFFQHKTVFHSCGPINEQCLVIF